MKIAILSHSAAQGGAEKVSTILANYFVKYGYRVYFFAVHHDKRQYYLNSKITYKYSRVNSGSKFVKQVKRIIAIRKFVMQNNIDVVISMVNIESIGLFGLKGIIKICSLRNNPNANFNRGINRILRNMAYRDADCIIFQTEEARDYFSKKIKHKGVIISNPVQADLPLWKECNHQKFIMTACRLTDQKNLKLMINAFRYFYDLHPDYQLRIYGNGEDEENLKKLVHELELDEAVQFMGNQTEIHKQMQIASLYVSSSNSEGISNSMLEALAIGLPCVCTDCPVGGARMFIENGKNGFLTSIGDSVALSRRMEEALQTFYDSNSTYITAIELRKRLSVENICNLWKEVIDSCLKKR